MVKKLKIVTRLTLYAYRGRLYLNMEDEMSNHGFQNWMSGVVNRVVRRTKLFKETSSRCNSAMQRAVRLERENDELSERVQEISKNLCRVNVQRRPDGSVPHMRICIELDTEMIERGFLHGNDAQVIEHIGRYIGAQAAREIRTANFARWEK